MSELAKRDTIVTQLEVASRALVKACDATDAMRVVDIARAIEVYARRQKLSKETIAYATTIKVDAMALMGEFLKARHEAGEMNTGMKGQLPPGPGRGHKGENGGTQSEPPFSAAPTLADLGIEKKESSDAQALAVIREKAPELYEQMRTGVLTIKAGRSAYAKVDPDREPPKEKPFDFVREGDAISAWLWGRLDEWPDDLLHTFEEFVIGIARQIQGQLNENERRGREGSAAA